MLTRENFEPDMTIFKQNINTYKRLIYNQSLRLKRLLLKQLIMLKISYVELMKIISGGIQSKRFLNWLHIYLPFRC